MDLAGMFQDYEIARRSEGMTTHSAEGIVRKFLHVLAPAEVEMLRENDQEHLPFCTPTECFKPKDGDQGEACFNWQWQHHGTPDFGTKQGFPPEAQVDRFMQLCQQAGIDSGDQLAAVTMLTKAGKIRGIIESFLREYDRKQHKAVADELRYERQEA